MTKEDSEEKIKVVVIQLNQMELIHTAKQNPKNMILLPKNI